MTPKHVSGTQMECRCGDITQQPDMEAIVNAANAQLLPGGGVAGAIHRAAGPGLAEECRPLAPIQPGQAVLTKGHELPNRFVIHCLGPVYGRDTPSDQLLASCYQQALALTERHGIRSIAFPALSAGAFGYPMKAAARVALERIIKELPKLSALETIRFVLFRDDDAALYQRIVQQLA